MNRRIYSRPALDFETEAVAALLKRGVAAGAFPGASARWGRPGEPARAAVAGRRGLTRNTEAATEDLSYDLASLTKVLVSASLALIFFSRGLLDLDQSLADGPLAAGPLAGRLGPGRRPAARIDWRRLTPRNLLAHQSGFRPWRPFYRLGGEPAARRELALEALRLERPECGPGTRTIYSDLNFIALGLLLEELGGASLETLFEREVARPLGLARAGFRPGPGPLAPTEDGFRWGGPPGHAEALFRGPTPLGRPHDDNAAWLPGGAGHAGLFAPAGEVWALAADWARAWAGGRGKIFDRPALAEFLRPGPNRPEPVRPLGFNIKNQVAALAASGWPEDAVGHLGYTGTSLWWDRESGFIWVLLTNRVHPRAVNPAWRPEEYVGGPF